MDLDRDLPQGARSEAELDMFDGWVAAGRPGGNFWIWLIQNVVITEGYLIDKSEGAHQPGGPVAYTPVKFYGRS